MTSTSGHLKCLKATIPARHAQSSIFPASAPKCSVNLRCQTYRITHPGYMRTLCPARMQSDSLSTASLRRNTLFNIPVIVTSSSDEKVKRENLRSSTSADLVSA
ncbi:hypothetical protein M378DRAFT_655843 [Amanita muscaria Koide BX008]|uniref:Uncharacterized protein n=1 Tax=Amanita muscaria (strain Koide BX008) TaxID=946122 RepID=A0A0C2X4S0_AMAMK|nr:hypothetical protein M378DRAFT_655843 [Amanita muscaria Koide BX008]